ncbi:hypothetical protein FGB62_22g022 [Gracilaria domingensis]|nr:hypothetical protein FGB62_22g022 [Gracilaria domingensis]
MPGGRGRSSDIHLPRRGHHDQLWDQFQWARLEAQLERWCGKLARRHLNLVDHRFGERAKLDQKLRKVNCQTTMECHSGQCRLFVSFHHEQTFFVKSNVRRNVGKHQTSTLREFHRRSTKLHTEMLVLDERVRDVSRKEGRREKQKMKMTYSSLTQAWKFSTALAAKISTKETYTITPAAIERHAANNRFFESRLYGMKNARAAPSVVLSPAAVTIPKARPTFPFWVSATQASISN